MSDDDKISELGLPYKLFNGDITNKKLRQVIQCKGGCIPIATSAPKERLEFIVKACNSYHDNQKLIDDQAEIIAAQNELIGTLEQALITEKSSRKKTISEQAERIEALEEKLWKIEMWTEAYPESIFPKITNEEFRRINELLKKELGIQLDRLSADYLRHLTSGIKQLLRVN